MVEEATLQMFPTETTLDLLKESLCNKLQKQSLQHLFSMGPNNENTGSHCVFINCHAKDDALSDIEDEESLHLSWENESPVLSMGNCGFLQKAKKIEDQQMIFANDQEPDVSNLDWHKKTSTGKKAETLKPHQKKKMEEDQQQAVSIFKNCS